MEYGGYIRTYSDKQFYFNDFSKNKLDIEEIAHALSNQCRWSGHARKFYSVAEHSVHCHNKAPEKYAFEALMHDASEAYVTDLSRPLKDFVPDYRKLQKNIEEWLAHSYGLPFPMSPEVRLVDDRMLVTEWIKLFRKTDIELGVKEEPYKMNLPCWNPAQAKKEFLELANEYLYI